MNETLLNHVEQTLIRQHVERLSVWLFTNHTIQLTEEESEALARKILEVEENE